MTRPLRCGEGRLWCNWCWNMCRAFDTTRRQSLWTALKCRWHQ